MGIGRSVLKIFHQSLELLLLLLLLLLLRLLKLVRRLLLLNLDLERNLTSVAGSIVESLGWNNHVIPPLRMILTSHMTWRRRKVFFGSV